MRKRRVFYYCLATAILGLITITGGCKKNVPASAATVLVSDAQFQEAYGFATRTPQGVDGFLAAYQLSKLWHDFTNSHAISELSHNPLIEQALVDIKKNGPIEEGWNQFNSRPDVVTWRAILADAFGQEFSITLANGATDRLSALRQLSDEMRFQRFLLTLKNKSVAPGTTPAPNDLPKVLPAVSANLKNVDVPPITLSFKMAAQRAVLETELQRLQAQLPPGVAKSAIQIEGSSFQSLIFEANKLVPLPQQENLQKYLHEATDTKTADEVFQWLMSRHVEIVYGFVDKFFILAAGPNHDHVKFASRLKDSVLGLPEMERCKAFVQQPVVSISWASAHSVMSSVRRIEFTPWVQRAKPYLQDELPPADIQKLEADAQRLDMKSRAFTPQDCTSMVGVIYRKGGLCTETFGGVKPLGAGPSKPFEFSGVPQSSTFLWMDRQTDPAVSQAFYDWLDDVAATSYDYVERFVLTKLPDQQKAQAGLVVNVVIPKLVELYRITRDQFGKSLGPERALAIDLNGTLPALPQVPAPLRGSGKMPRLAYLASVQDRALLAKSWSSYVKFAQELLLMLPFTPPQLKGGLPPPTEKTVGALTSYSYPVPDSMGDLLPNVSIWKDKVFIASSSSDFAQQIGKGLDKSATDKSMSELEFRLQFSPLYDFANQWMAVAAQNPDAFFAGNAAKRDQFLKNQPDLTKLVQSLRAFTGIEGHVFNENGTRHATLALHFNDAPAH